MRIFCGCAVFWLGSVKPAGPLSPENEAGGAWRGVNHLCCPAVPWSGWCRARPGPALAAPHSAFTLLGKFWQTGGAAAASTAAGLGH